MVQRLNQTLQMLAIDQEKDELDIIFVAAVIHKMLFLLKLPACEDLE